MKFNFWSEVPKTGPSLSLCSGAALDKNMFLTAFQEGKAIGWQQTFSKYHEHVCVAE
jgi:hypothetical protein